MQQLSERMAEQRLQVADRIRRNMAFGNGVRILPRDVEAGLKEFASGVELMVDRLVRCARSQPCFLGIYPRCRFYVLAGVFILQNRSTT